MALITSATVFPVTNIFSATLGGVILLLAGYYAYTWIRFQIDFRRFTRTSTDDSKALKAPHLPIAIPWVGNAPAFLSVKPHKFWKELMSWYPRAAGACNITLGGQTTTIVFTRPAIQYVIRDRKMGREALNYQVALNALGMARSEVDKFYEYGKQAQGDYIPGYIEQERINHEYLLKTDRVNEMTTEFMKVLQQSTGKDFQDGAVIDMNKWLRSRMFEASTIALMGKEIINVIPDVEKLFFQFDADMMPLFFGLPKFMVRKKVSNRDNCLDGIVKWHQSVESKSSGEIVDPDSVAWEPMLGSRVNRARFIFYKKKGLQSRAAASGDLGMLFGISSNAIPAAGWMLFHIIDSMRTTGQKNEPTLYDEVMSELKESQNGDGSLNVPVLMNQPILLSCLHEVLRFYVDTFMSRASSHDITLPLSEASTKDSSPSRSLFVKAGSLLMIPTWLAHNDPGLWQQPGRPSTDVFYPYRFLSAPPNACGSDKPVFSTAPYNGMLFPFGGGKTICPGRVFAKQEILAAVATVMLAFDFEVLGYVDARGRETTKFPGLRDTLPGSVVMVPSGDLKVKIQRR